MAEYFSNALLRAWFRRLPVALTGVAVSLIAVACATTPSVPEFAPASQESVPPPRPTASALPTEVPQETPLSESVSKPDATRPPDLVETPSPTPELLEVSPTSTPIPPTPVPADDPVPLDSEVQSADDTESRLALYKSLNPTGPKSIDARQFNQLLPPDAIRPIYSPSIGLPDDVELATDELVMGVSLGDESRAYPIRVLRHREMVNDELGGVPILVTW